MPSIRDTMYRTVMGEVGTFQSNLTEPTANDRKIQGYIDEVLLNGFVVIRNAFSKSEVDEAKAELNRLTNSGEGGITASTGRNSFEGLQTGRIYALLDKSRAFDKFISHPDILALNDYFLQPEYLINAFHSITIHPGEQPQTLHHDDGHITLRRPHDILGTGVIVALDHFTEANGATVVIPKSHLWDEGRYPTRSETTPVLMESGSVVYFLGTLWHGGGRNLSGRDRMALNMQYCQPYLRPFENHMLAVSWDKLSQIPPKVVDMMGFKMGAPFIGSVDGRSPLRAVERRLIEYRNRRTAGSKL